MLGPKGRMDDRYAITFGESALLHVGGKEYGNKRRQSGYSKEELLSIASENDTAEVIDLSRSLPQIVIDSDSYIKDACVLVIRNGVSILHDTDGVSFADQLYNEQKTVSYDRKYFDQRRRKTLNKIFGSLLMVSWLKNILKK